MPFEFKPESFKNAFDREHAKKYDLSPISRVNLGEFKELMVKSAERFIECAGDEEIPNNRYLIRRMHRAVYQLLHVLGYDNALDLISKIDICKHITAEEIFTRVESKTYFPITQKISLKELTESYISFWERNKEHLIKTGYSKTLFKYRDWIPGLFDSLYPTKKLIKIESVRKDQFGDTICEHYWIDENTSSPHIYDDDFAPEAHHYKEDKTLPKYKNQLEDKPPKYDYEYAGDYKFLGFLDILGKYLTEGNRAVLYETYLEIFYILRDSIDAIGKNDLHKKVFSHLFKKLGKFVEILIPLDSYQSGRSNNSIQGAYILTLLELTGYYEKENEYGLIDLTAIMEKLKKYVFKYSGGPIFGNQVHSFASVYSDLYPEDEDEVEEDEEDDIEEEETYEKPDSKRGNTKTSRIRRKRQNYSGLHSGRNAVKRFNQH